MSFVMMLNTAISTSNKWFISVSILFFPACSSPRCLPAVENRRVHPSADMSERTKTPERSVSENDVIQYSDPKQFSCSDQPIRCFQIFPARLRVSTWMIMDKNHRSGTLSDSTDKNLSRMNYCT